MRRQLWTGLLGGIAVLTLGGLTPAYARSPWHPTASASPDTDLNDGQTVQVSGAGFQEQQIQIVECGGGNIDKFGAHPVCTYFTSPRVNVASAAAGTFGPTAFTVARVLVGTMYVRGTRTTAATHDCLPANDCFIRVVSTTRKWLRVDIPITFATP